MWKLTGVAETVDRVSRIQGLSTAAGARLTAFLRILLQIFFVSNQRFHLLLARLLIPMATPPMSPSATVQEYKIQPFLLDHPTFVIPPQLAQLRDFLHD